MNFLAHLYLSKEIPALQIGNFVADSVKGNHYLHYPVGIQKGILLHREIDFFTDNHAVFRKSKQLLVPHFGLYAGVIIDMFYDHFLAKNWHLYHHQPLPNFIQQFYQLLQNNAAVLPAKVQQFLPIMLRDNWLLQYATTQGLHTILQQMDHRTRNQSGMANAIDFLEKDYEVYEQDFFAFFTEICFFVEGKINDML